MAPPRPTQIRLAGGRKLRAQLSPDVARRADVDRLRRTSAANDRRIFRHVDELGRAKDDLEHRVAALEEERDQSLMGLVDAFSGLARRLESARGEQAAALARTRQELEGTARQEVKALRSELRAQASAARIQQLSSVVTSAQGAAFGQKGSILATNNLLLAGSQLLWMFLEPLLGNLGVPWLAPLGTLATGQLALGGRQSQRIITGVATFPPGVSVVQISLADRVASSVWPEFSRRTDVGVALLDEAIGNKGGFRPSVANGTLTVTMVRGAQPNAVSVTFLVDTGIGDG
jgi:hypothetical protein